MDNKGARSVLAAAILTTPRVVTAISGGSLLVLLIKILWLDNVPAVFPYATDLGLLVENICAATVAAYLFFLISIQVPQVREQQRLGPTIIRLTSEVADSMVFFLRMVRNAAAPELVGTETAFGAVTQKLITEWFEKLSPADPSPLLADTHSSQRLNWLQVMLHQDAQCHSRIEKVWRYSKFIESELARLLDSIDSSPFARKMEFWRELTSPKSVQLDIPNLTTWAEAFFDCWEKTVRLALYTESYRAKYGIARGLS